MNVSPNHQLYFSLPPNWHPFRSSLRFRHLRSQSLGQFPPGPHTGVHGGGVHVLGTCYSLLFLSPGRSQVLVGFFGLFFVFADHHVLMSLVSCSLGVQELLNMFSRLLTEGISPCIGKSVFLWAEGGFGAFFFTILLISFPGSNPSQ